MTVGKETPYLGTHVNFLDCRSLDRCVLLAGTRAVRAMALSRDLFGRHVRGHDANDGCFQQAEA